MRGKNPRKPRKWGAYASEAEDFRFARQGCSQPFEQTPEAFLMDWADDITYSVHDLEDFYQAGRIPLHLLALERSQEQDYFFEDVFRRQAARGNTAAVARSSELKEVFRDLILLTFSTTEEYRGTSRQRANLKNFTGSLVGRYINGVQIVERGGKVRLEVNPQFIDEVMMLKELIWTYVIQNPALTTQQVGQRHMIQKLFSVYTEAAASSREAKIFPAYHRERLQETKSDAERVRICTDLIAGLTENQVHRIYNRLTGSANESSLNDPLG